MALTAAVTPAATSQLEALIEALVDLAKTRCSPQQRDLVTQFIGVYYLGAAVDDLGHRKLEDLYGAAFSHLNFARERKPGTPLVRIYNPSPERHGWQSTHTIVEIVTDDMPFLVDSVRMAINRSGLTSHLIVHPVVQVVREAGGRLLGVRHDHEDVQEGVPGIAIGEAIIHLEVDRQTEQSVHDELLGALKSTLGDVRCAVEDWPEMRERLRSIIQELDSDPPPLDPAELDEARAFLRWVDADHFTFLGYREYELHAEGDGDQLHAVASSGLGVLRYPVDATADGHVSHSFAQLPLEVRAMAREPNLIVLTKANSRSTVHRPSYIDYLGIKRMNAAGEVEGERRFLGLYTSAAYTRVPRDIPLLRRKVAAVLNRSQYTRGSHDAKALTNILDTFPRDLLFQIGDDALYETALGILHLQERQRVCLFMHRERYGRYYSCIVYVPRDRFNTQTRLAIQERLIETVNAIDSEFTVQLSESVLARLYFELHVDPRVHVDIDHAKLEAQVAELTRQWSDGLAEALLEHFGEERGSALVRRYGDAFRAHYREQYSPRIAVQDVARLECLRDEPNALAMSLYRPLEAADDELHFKLFRAGGPIALSDALPMLENMGLRVVDENPAKIKRSESARVWMHDFGLRYPNARAIDLERVQDKFQDAFAGIWRGEIENDGFNRLVLGAGLAWRQVVVLRACCKYLRQAQVPFSQVYMEQALAGNPGVARQLVKLFETRFDPAFKGEREAEADACRDEIAVALDDVANLDEDRILRNFLGLMLAMTRTNFYQHAGNAQRAGEGTPKLYVSFKFDPARVPELPAPRPMFEIFVYSPRVEGVHLRGGPVARGGLRWSDRREDFRTEVLGLVKAQMVKNAVIVPVGSKGGFVPKRLPVGGDRDAVHKEGVACYRTFIQGLLDVTDNLVGGEVVPPPRVIRHDGDDPYLVVAADKGTATFSDIANEISADYEFWLGDAFASGGSQGYDHKGMGITARGAWESVKRHFRELGLNTQRQPFSVVGIGDMSGDVFGNGMLLSPQIKLVGAFNHLHIFLDPMPDAVSGFAERQRLFALPRSTWDDYDRSLLSAGGGIYPRSAKSIDITPEVRECLGVEAHKLAPVELIQAMLKAPVDLLWNGGIGTYVKSSNEHHDAAGDRANDAVRVNADALRCRVIGEGGNLGFTQAARVEFSQAGGHVYTDAIDNAGGVNCSDHEVNIKVLLNDVVQSGDMTMKQRNALLESMTDEVGELVLRDNYLQTQALSLAAAQAPAMLDVHARALRHLERVGGLDRAIEHLPDKEELDERHAAGTGLTGPELSVVMAYVKINLFVALLESDFPDDPYLTQVLAAYFPKPLREQFAERMPRHRLCREIVSTQMANELVNRLGTSFMYRLEEETGTSPADVTRAYLASRDIFGMEGIWAEIEALDNLVPAEVQHAMLFEGRKLVERSTRWLLRHQPLPLDVSG
ncbi:MAG: NAD-glutamate dehydrogenase, partial [Gammaproteobacteria bacterium]